MFLYCCAQFHNLAWYLDPKETPLLKLAALRHITNIQCDFCTVLFLFVLEQWINTLAEYLLYYVLLMFAMMGNYSETPIQHF